MSDFSARHHSVVVPCTNGSAQGCRRGKQIAICCRRITLIRVLDSVQLVETFSEGVLQKNLHHWSFLLPSLLLTFIYSQSSVTQVTLEWISPNFSSTRVSFLDPIVFAVTPNCLASFLIQLDFLFSDFQLLPLNYINDRLHSRKYGLVCSCNKYHS